AANYRAAMARRGLLGLIGSDRATTFFFPALCGHRISAIVSACLSHETSLFFNGLAHRSNRPAAGFLGRDREQLERPPRVRRRERVLLADEIELRLPQRPRRRHAGREALVKLVHQQGGRAIVDIPQAGDDTARAGAKKGPRKSNEALAGIGTLTCTAARRHRHEIGSEWERSHVARVQLV